MLLERFPWAGDETHFHDYDDEQDNSFESEADAEELAAASRLLEGVARSV